MINENKGIFNYLKLKRKYNALLNKYETLLDMSKNECFKVVFQKINEIEGYKRLKSENKNLRLKVKTLQELVKEVNYERDNSKKTRNKSINRNKKRSRTKGK